MYTGKLHLYFTATERFITWQHRKRTDYIVFQVSTSNHRRNTKHKKQKLLRFHFLETYWISLVWMNEWIDGKIIQTFCELYSCSQTSYEQICYLHTIIQFIPFKALKSNDIRVATNKTKWQILRINFLFVLMKCTEKHPFLFGCFITPIIMCITWRQHQPIYRT